MLICFCSLFNHKKHKKCTLSIKSYTLSSFYLVKRKRKYNFDFEKQKKV